MARKKLGEMLIEAGVLTESWRDTVPMLVDFLRELEVLNPRRPHTHDFVAELDGKPIAAGSMCINEGVATLAGAATLPSHRKLGAQYALLDARLRFARAGLRSGHDGGAAGQRLAKECRAERVPDRLHTPEMGVGNAGKAISPGSGYRPGGPAM